jgi:hypothetical protein
MLDFHLLKNSLKKELLDKEPGGIKLLKTNLIYTILSKYLTKDGGKHSCGADYGDIVSNTDKRRKTLDFKSIRICEN